MWSCLTKCVSKVTGCFFLHQSLLEWNNFMKIVNYMSLFLHKSKLPIMVFSSTHWLYMIMYRKKYIWRLCSIQIIDKMCLKKSDLTLIWWAMDMHWTKTIAMREDTRQCVGMCVSIWKTSLRCHHGVSRSTCKLISLPWCGWVIV